MVSIGSQGGGKTRTTALSLLVARTATALVAAGLASACELEGTPRGLRRSQADARPAATRAVAIRAIKSDRALL